MPPSLCIFWNKRCLQSIFQIPNHGPKRISLMPQTSRFLFSNCYFFWVESIRCGKTILLKIYPHWKCSSRKKHEANSHFVPSDTPIFRSFWYALVGATLRVPKNSCQTRNAVGMPLAGMLGQLLALRARQIVIRLLNLSHFGDNMLVSIILWRVGVSNFPNCHMVVPDNERLHPTCYDYMCLSFICFFFQLQLFM